MGSDEKKNFFDNSSELFYKDAGHIIKTYFSIKLTSFKFVRGYDDPRGYWGFYFSYDKTTIFIGCERAFIDYSIEVAGTKIPLSTFDKRVLLLERTSEKNFIFLLDTIRKYLMNMKLA